MSKKLILKIIYYHSLELIILGSVDAANNLRDNMISYHDIIATERWEMRFLGFFFGNM